MKSPLLNALCATLYITCVVKALQLTQTFIVPVNTILVPMVMLSLLTLAAAVMGFLFAKDPITMYLDGKKQEAVTFFFSTISIFAGVTAVLVIILLALVQRV